MSLPFLKKSIDNSQSTIVHKKGFTLIELLVARHQKPWRRKAILSGFTLIELLVVIAIIGLLATLTTASFSRAQANARDARRRNDLRELQKALLTYYQDNNAYPITSGWCSSEPGDLAAYCNSGQYIPGLTPTYISVLPRDPKGGPSANPQCGAVWKRAYLYTSGGTNYKLLSHCAPEGRITGDPQDPFYDPLRPTWAWALYTKGAAGW